MTQDYLIKVHEAFDELGFRPKNSYFTMSQVQEAAINTLNHTKELEDGINAARMFQFIVKDFDKIKKKINSNLLFWQNLSYQDNELISLVSDEEAQGTFFVTNSFDSNYKEVSICGVYFDNEVIGVRYSFGKFTIKADSSDDVNYYLRYSKLSSTKMVLLNKNDEKLCVLVLSKDLDVFLENNKTDFDIVLYESGMGIYKKRYIESLHGKDADVEKCLAFIEWDILEKKSELGLARLEIWDEDADLEMFLYFAMATFLLFKSYISASRAASLAVINSTWAIKR